MKYINAIERMPPLKSENIVIVYNGIEKIIGGRSLIKELLNNGWLHVFWLDESYPSRADFDAGYTEGFIDGRDNKAGIEAAWQRRLSNETIMYKIEEQDSDKEFKKRWGGSGII